jgi:hypothetical protein
VPDKAVNLARGELALSGGQPAQILRGNLPQALGVGFLYESTSTRAKFQRPGIWLNYKEQDGPA